MKFQKNKKIIVILLLSSPLISARLNISLPPEFGEEQATDFVN